MENNHSQGSTPRSPAADDSSSAAAAGPHKLKFLCSYGGRIKPRPHDNRLAYSGGDTKIVAVDKSIRFPAFVARLAAASGLSDDFYVKYRLTGEDLDALVSVTNEQDLDHLMAEYDRAARVLPKPARMRLFLFSRSPPVVPSGPPPPAKPDSEWLVDALNAAPVQAAMDQSATISDYPDFLFGLDKGFNQAPPPVFTSKVDTLVKSESDTLPPLPVTLFTAEIESPVKSASEFQPPPPPPPTKPQIEEMKGVQIVNQPPPLEIVQQAEGMNGVRTMNQPLPPVEIVRQAEGTNGVRTMNQPQSPVDNVRQADEMNGMRTMNQPLPPVDIVRQAEGMNGVRTMNRLPPVDTVRQAEGTNGVRTMNQPLSPVDIVRQADGMNGVRTMNQPLPPVDIVRPAEGINVVRAMNQPLPPVDIVRQADGVQIMNQYSRPPQEMEHQIEQPQEYLQVQPMAPPLPRFYPGVQSTSGQNGQGFYIVPQRPALVAECHHRGAGAGAGAHGNPAVGRTNMAYTGEGGVNMVRRAMPDLVYRHVAYDSAGRPLYLVASGGAYSPVPASVVETRPSRVDSNLGNSAAQA